MCMTECRTEFETRAMFEQHLRSTHEDIISSNNMDRIIETCQRLSLKSQEFAQQDCPLCGVPYKETPGWKDHIAHHLEQFALLVIGDSAELSEDELDRH